MICFTIIHISFNLQTFETRLLFFAVVKFRKVGSFWKQNSAKSRERLKRVGDVEMIFLRIIICLGVWKYRWDTHNGMQNHLLQSQVNFGVKRESRISDEHLG